VARPNTSHVTKDVPQKLERLQEMLRHPLQFTSKPSGLIAELQKRGVKHIDVIISGFDFSESVQATCKKQGFHVNITNCEGFSIIS
jgi:hypothetical protein